MNEDIELYNDFQKACDHANHSFLEKLLDAYDIPLGI